MRHTNGWRGLVWLFGLIAVCAGILASCQSFSDTETGELDPGEYWIYYLDTSTTKLSPHKYRAQATETDDLIAELMSSSGCDRSDDPYGHGSRSGSSRRLRGNA